MSTSDDALSSGRHPVIKPLRFLESARSVLPREDSGFTDWLSGNLELLEDLLGVSSLTLVETESPVGSFSLDILATGQDVEGQEIAVPIENQYGKTDHDHLGKLVTYTAQAATGSERVRGVWLVESARDEHLAAVTFLNEISPPRIGWVLAEVRFVEAPNGAYYVHFEPKTRPNLVLAEGATRRGVNPELQERCRRYLDAVLHAAEPMFRGIDFGHIHSYGHSRRIDLPETLPLAAWAELRLMASQAYTRLNLVTLSPSRAPAESEAVLELLRERYEAALIMELASDTEVNWHGRSSAEYIDWVSLTLRNGGYMEGDPVKAAEWLGRCCAAWFKVLMADPVERETLQLIVAEATEQEAPEAD